MNDDTNKKLLILLKIFKNRPNHLIKYLSGNNAFSKDFIDKVNNSVNLTNENITNHKNFNDISEMNLYYSTLLDDFNLNDDTNDLLIKLNDKLNLFLESEDYENAIRIRDYMLDRKIKRIEK